LFLFFKVKIKLGTLIFCINYRLSLFVVFLLETNASEAIGPIGWYEDPKANCPFAVATARAPNITEPE
jgi:hypothetical protein